jgi:hypothetical protein
MIAIADTEVINRCWHARRSYGPIDVSLFAADVDSVSRASSPHTIITRHRDDYALHVLPAESWRVAVVTLGAQVNADALSSSTNVERVVPFPLDDDKALVFCHEPMPIERWAALTTTVDQNLEDVVPVRESVAECMAAVLSGKEGLSAKYAGRFADADDELYLVNHPAMRGIDLTDVVPHAGRLLLKKGCCGGKTTSWYTDVANSEEEDGEEDDDGADSLEHDGCVDWEL